MPTRPFRRTPSVLAALALAAGSIAGCANCAIPGAMESSGAPPGGSAAVPDAPAVREVTTLDGVKLTVPTPGTVTVLHFFALSCARCLEGLQAVAATQNAVPANYVAIDIDPTDRPEDIRSMMVKAGNPPIPVAPDSGAVLLRTWRITTPGVTIVVDSTGRSVFRGVDSTSQALTQAVRMITP